MGWLDKLLGREAKAGGDGAGDAPRGESTREPQGMSEPATEEAPPAAEPEKEAES